MATIPSAELTPDQLDAILADIRENAGGPEGSVAKIAKRHNLSTSTLQRLAAKHGMGDAWRSGSAATAEAVAARLTAAAARRADLQHLLLTDAEELRARLFDDVPIWAMGQDVDIDGGRTAHLVKDTITSGPGDWRNVMTSVGIAVDKVVQLAKLEADNANANAATGLLDSFEKALRERRLEREHAQTETEDS